MDYDDYALPIVTTLPEELALATASAQSVTPDASPAMATATPDAKPVASPVIPVVTPVATTATTTTTTPSASTPILTPAIDVSVDDYTLESPEGVQELDYEDLLGGDEATSQTILSVPAAASAGVPSANNTATSITTASATSVKTPTATVSAAPVNNSATSVAGTPPVMSPPVSSLDYSGDDESEYYFLQDLEDISEDELGSQNTLSNVSSSPVPLPAISLSSPSPVTAILTSTIPSPAAAVPPLPVPPLAMASPVPLPTTDISPVPSPAAALSPAPVPSPAVQVPLLPDLSLTASGGTAARPNTVQTSAAADVDTDSLPGHGHAGGLERKRPRKRPGVGRVGDEGGRHHRGGEVSREFDSPHKVTAGSGSAAGEDLAGSSKSAPDRGEQQGTVSIALQPAPPASKSVQVEAMDNPGSEYEASWGIKGVDVW